MSQPFNADAIIVLIDEGTLQPMANAVARALLKEMAFDHEIIDQYDRGEAKASLPEMEALWNQIKSLPLDRQGALRLVHSLMSSEGILDGYAAEFFIDWARQQGVSERAIGEAFGLDMSGR